MSIPSIDGLLQRPRVAQAIQEALKLPFVLVHGPIGSGKSSSVALALADDSRPAVWHQVQPWHSDDFVRPLVEAVRERREDFGRRTLAIAENSRQDALAAQRIGATLSEELGHLSEPIVLVIDDAHLLYSEPKFAGFIESAARTLPRQAHLVVITRASAQFAIGELISQHRARSIDAETLRFTSDEVHEFARSRGASQDRINAIVAATEGWPVGVALALDYGAQALSAVALGTAIDSVLADGVLARLTPERRSFLESIIVFETIDVRVLERQIGWQDVRAQISALQQYGALVSVFETGTVFRIHPLFRESITRSIQAANGSESLREFHARAARAYESAGQLSAALYHVERAGNRELDLEFLRNHARDAQRSGGLRRIAEIAERLQKNGAVEEPAALYVNGLVAKAAGAPNARQLLFKASERADEINDKPLAFSALAEATEIAMGRLEPVSREDIAQLDARASSLGAAATATAAVLGGWTDALRGDLHAALGRVGGLVDAGDPSMRFDAVVLRAYVETVLGDPAAAERTLTRLLRALEATDRIVVQTLTLVWYGRLALLWGETTIALDAAREATRLSADLDLRAEEGARALTLAQAALHGGDTTAAVTAAAELRARGAAAWYEADARRAESMAQAIQSRAAFLDGNIKTAIELARAGACDTMIPSTQRACLYADAATFAILLNRDDAPQLCDDAKAALAAATIVDVEDAAQLATSFGILSWFEPSIEIPKSPFDGVIARRDAVQLPTLGVALRSVRNGKGPSAALDAGIEILTKRGPRFEAAVARVAAAQSVRGDERPGLSVDLTPREKEVLALLADGLTNKEMALRLYLSPRTIDTHVERVLGKLDVRTRSQAVAKALRLGLVTNQA